MKLRLLTNLRHDGGEYAAGQEIESESLGINPQALLASASAEAVAPLETLPPETAEAPPAAPASEPVPPVRTMERKARGGRRTTKREG